MTDVPTAIIADVGDVQIDRGTCIQRTGGQSDCGVFLPGLFQCTTIRS